MLYFEILTKIVKYYLFTNQYSCCKKSYDDLEHIADYITFINNKKIFFTKTRDAILENYGIVSVQKLSLM